MQNIICPLVSWLLKSLVDNSITNYKLVYVIICNLLMAPADYLSSLALNYPWIAHTATIGRFGDDVGDVSFSPRQHKLAVRTTSILKRSSCSNWLTQTSSIYYSSFYIRNNILNYCPLVFYSVSFLV